MNGWSATGESGIYHQHWIGIQVCGDSTKNQFFLGCRFFEDGIAKGTFHQQDIGITWIMCYFVLWMGQVQQVVASKNRCYQPSQHQLAPTSGLFWLVGWLNHWAMFFLFWKVGRWLVGGDALNRSILVIQMGITIQSSWGNFWHFSIQRWIWPWLKTYNTRFLGNSHRFRSQLFSCSPCHHVYR